MRLREISFEILQACPNNCIYCSSYSTMYSKPRISYEVFQKVIDDAVKLGLEVLSLSGGEPFLHPNLIDMVKYTKGSGNIQVNVYTSGIMYNKGKADSLDEDLLTQLKVLNVNKVIFNVQAAGEDLYDSIMGTKGNFALLQQSIERAVKVGLYTEIHFVPMKKNYKEINSVIDMAQKLGVQEISFLRLVIQGRALGNRQLIEMTDEEVKKLKEILLKAKVSFSNIKIRIGIPLSEKIDNKRCHAGVSKLIIRYDGDVYPCEAFKYLEKIGAIKPSNVNRDSLIEICNKSEFLSVIKNDIVKVLNDSTNCEETCPAQLMLLGNFYR